MRRSIIAAALVVAVAAPALGQSRDRLARTITEDFDRSGHEAVVFDLNVGEIEIAGASTDTIRAEVRILCPRNRDRDRCEDRAEDIELVATERRGKLYLEVDGTGLWKSRDAHVEVVLTVPNDLATELEVGTGEVSMSDIEGDVSLDLSIGEATLTNLSGDLNVDMGIGEITVTMPQSAVGEVTLDNGVGETELRHLDGRNAVEGILGGTDVHWDNGTGPHTVKVDLNIARSQFGFSSLRFAEASPPRGGSPLR